MARPSKTEQEIGYLRSFWEEVREIEADFGGAVTIFAVATKRVGVINLRLVFVPLLSDAENPLASHAYSFNFPNAGATSFAGSLWDGALKLRDLVTDGARLRSPRQQ